MYACNQSSYDNYCYMKWYIGQYYKWYLNQWYLIPDSNIANTTCANNAKQIVERMRECKRESWCTPLELFVFQRSSGDINNGTFSGRWRVYKC